MRDIIGAILAAVLGAFALNAVLPQYINAVVQPPQNDAGSQLNDVLTSGQNYIRQNFAALVTATAGGPKNVTPAMMLAAGDQTLLGFQDYNVFGQSHVMSVYQPSANVLEAYIFTYGGQTIDDNTLVRVAEAGPPESAVVLAADPTNFEGAAGGGAVRPISLFTTGLYPVTSGHLAVHILPVTYQSEQPYVNRYSTGNPDDNTMHTDFNMGGNNITNAKTVTATQQVNTPMLADPTTPTMQVTPAGSSRISTLTATGPITAPAFLYPP